MADQSTSAASAHGTSRSGASAGIRGLWWKALAGVWMVAGTLAAFLAVGPAYGFSMRENPESLYGYGAKIIFFHVPCAWLATLAYVVAAVYAVCYLSRLRHGGPAIASPNDLKCASAMELGLLFAALATITGSIFAHNEWGTYWRWNEPRMVSIFVVLLIFAAYLVLRGAIVRPDQRARLCSAYAIVAVVPGLFLIWVLPRIVSYTLHSGPNKAVVGGGLDAHFRMVLYGGMLPAFLMLFVWLFQVRLRAMKLEALREDSNE